MVFAGSDTSWSSASYFSMVLSHGDLSIPPTNNSLISYFNSDNQSLLKFSIHRMFLRYQRFVNIEKKINIYPFHVEFGLTKIQSVLLSLCLMAVIEELSSRILTCSSPSSFLRESAFLWKHDSLFTWLNLFTILTISFLSLLFGFYLDDFSCPEWGSLLNARIPVNPFANVCSCFSFSLAVFVRS